LKVNSPTVSGRTLALPIHWEVWCLGVDVKVDPEHLGRNFFPRRDRYNFTEPNFLDCRR
jgi:hypothetical protein